MSLKFLASSLNNISVEDVESILITLILEGKLDGKIDQVNGILTKNSATKPNLIEDTTFDAIDKLTSALEKLTTSVTVINEKGISQREQTLM